LADSPALKVAPTMSMAFLRYSALGRALIKTSLKGVDPQTKRSLCASWEGNLESLVTASGELGPATT
jgi:hypothetical protein